MSTYFLGVDGAQSSTTAIIGDGRSGPRNHLGRPKPKPASSVQWVKRWVRPCPASHFRSACGGAEGNFARQMATREIATRGVQFILIAAADLAYWGLEEMVYTDAAHHIK